MSHAHPNHSSHSQILVDYQCEIGENPLWHPMEKRLYWCDIPKGRIFRYDPATGHHEICLEGEPIGGFTIESDGALLLFMARGAIKRWHNRALTTILTEIEEERESRFNDVIADPEGRVFCGTMPTPQRLGRLYRLDKDLSLTVVLEGVGCANGMAFSLDHKRMYFTDSAARKIYCFDYERRTGTLANQRVFINTYGEEGVPDGATVDAEGHLWSARWDGSCVLRYTPDGIEERRIPINTKKASSITFGGEHLSDLYITTAGGDLRHENGKDAGALYQVSMDIQGVPEFCSHIAGASIP